MIVRCTIAIDLPIGFQSAHESILKSIDRFEDKLTRTMVRDVPAFLREMADEVERERSRLYRAGSKIEILED